MMRRAAWPGVLALAACATPPPPAPPAHAGGAPLVGTEWRLEDLLGGGVIDNSHVTLKLESDGAGGGTGGCNRYFTSWKSQGDRLTLGKGGSTLMACAPALMNQEGKYLRALEAARSYAFTPDGALVIATAQGALKFRRD